MVRLLYTCNYIQYVPFVRYLHYYRNTSIIIVSKEESPLITSVWRRVYITLSCQYSLNTKLHWKSIYSFLREQYLPPRPRVGDTLGVSRRTKSEYRKDLGLHKNRVENIFSRKERRTTFNVRVKTRDSGRK